MPAVFPAWVNVVDGIIAAVLPPVVIAIFISAIKYAAYDFFIGAYPNDDKTTAVVRELEQRFPNVHLALCPHDGPTSKADCLKWIYQRMLLFEENSGVKFAAVIVHDAEDLIHPESLLTSNYYLDTYDMAQIPVLALPTPFDKLTHGVYCDDVAEFRIEDMQARAAMEASSLRTASALLISARPCSFSRTPKATVSSSRPAQSKITKKVYGISRGFLYRSTAARMAWWPHASTSQERDALPSASALFGSPASRSKPGSAMAGRASPRRSTGSGATARIVRKSAKFRRQPDLCSGRRDSGAGAHLWPCWGSRPAPDPSRASGWKLTILAIHLSIRMYCVARIYGLVFALGVPVRVVYGNYLNAWASFGALKRYLAARLRHEPLVRVKTEHGYLGRTALLEHRRRLGEVLVGSLYLGSAQLEFALRVLPGPAPWAHTWFG